MPPHGEEWGGQESALAETKEITGNGGRVAKGSQDHHMPWPVVLTVHRPLAAGASGLRGARCCMPLSPWHLNVSFTGVPGRGDHTRKHPTLGNELLGRPALGKDSIVQHQHLV